MGSSANNSRCRSDQCHGPPLPAAARRPRSPAGRCSSRWGSGRRGRQHPARSDVGGSPSCPPWANVGTSTFSSAMHLGKQVVVLKYETDTPVAKSGQFRLGQRGTDLRRPAALRPAVGDPGRRRLQQRALARSRWGRGASFCPTPIAATRRGALRGVRRGWDTLGQITNGQIGHGSAAWVSGFRSAEANASLNRRAE